MRITRKQFDAAVQTLEDESEYEVEVRSDYSGRGMYGRTCFGVVGSYPATAFHFMLALAEQVYPTKDYFEMKDFLLEMAERMRTDSMGYDTIFYFPGIDVEKADENDA